MMSTQKSAVVLVLTAIGLGVGTGVAVSAVQAQRGNASVLQPARPAAASGQSAPAPEGVSTFKKNARGLTYGSAGDSVTTGVEPDLVLVVASNGQEGYVFNRDLEGPQPSSPEEASQPQFQSPAPRTITVYTSDGVTRVGSFTVGG